MLPKAFNNKHFALAPAVRLKLKNMQTMAVPVELNKTLKMEMSSE